MYIAPHSVHVSIPTNVNTPTDVNECFMNTHNCQQICVNTAGGFECGCDPDYELICSGIDCTGLCIILILGIFILIHAF